MYLLLKIIIILVAVIGDSKWIMANTNEAGIVRTCPNNFVRFGTSCYYLSNRTVSWQEAYFECSQFAKQSKLAVMDTLDNDKIMREYLTKSDIPQVERWIAGIYDWKIMKWIWGTTGKRLEYQAFSRTSIYDNNQWKCIAMNPELYHRWSPRNCIERKSYICQTPTRSDRTPLNYVRRYPK